MLTDYCNFSCNYCYDKLHSGLYHKGIKSGFPTEQEIVKFLNDLGDKHLNGRYLVTQLSGGEPVLHPMLSYIVERLKEYEGYLGINTNGSRGEAFWKSILPLSNLTISLHPEYLKPEKANMLGKLALDTGTPLKFNLSCDNKRWDDVVSFYEMLDPELKPYCQPKILHVWSGPNPSQNYVYTEEQRKWIDDISNNFMEARRNEPVSIPNSFMIFRDGSAEPVANLTKITINEWHKMKGWRCQIGSEGLNVHYSGEVYAGLCKARHLGRIDNFNLLTEKIICQKERCIGPADLRVNKTI
jgi:MoaA/NifB/PqqE/SkfB family radical SAM enzyme